MINKSGLLKCSKRNEIHVINSAPKCMLQIENTGSIK